MKTLHFILVEFFHSCWNIARLSCVWEKKNKIHIKITLIFVSDILLISIGELWKRGAKKCRLYNDKKIEFKRKFINSLSATFEFWSWIVLANPPPHIKIATHDFPKFQYKIKLQTTNTHTLNSLGVAFGHFHGL